VSDDTVYQMTKAMFTNLPALVAAHSAAKGISLQNAAKTSPIPLHPGAIKYYKEVGLLK
jgi:TRAP transporter TAXI family solute receptor